MPSKVSEGFFELALRCPGTRLPLTSEEAGAVISEDNLVTCHLQKSAVSHQRQSLVNDIGLLFHKFE
jgi:hypothetical protein